RLLVAVSVMIEWGEGDVGIPNVSGGGLSWQLVASARGESSWSDGLFIFSARVGSSDLEMSVTLNDDNNEQVYTWAVLVVQISGDDGESSIYGVASSGTYEIPDGSYSLTLTASPGEGDITLLYLMTDADNAPVEPLLDSGWTLVDDLSVPAGGAGLVCARREGSTSSIVNVLDVYRAGGNLYNAAMVAFIVRAQTAIIATPGMYLWMLANSYYEQLQGVEAGLERPSGMNAGFWGQKFFGV
ncbi:MAG TPA: hypothetical protein VNK49_07940, partial [Anaerolineales bacterium]|nr:hypothetical protein [Anaerolineales bacterium]